MDAPQATTGEPESATGDRRWADGVAHRAAIRQADVLVRVPARAPARRTLGLRRRAWRTIGPRAAGDLRDSADPSLALPFQGREPTEFRAGSVPPPKGRGQEGVMMCADYADALEFQRPSAASEPAGKDSAVSHGRRRRAAESGARKNPAPSDRAKYVGRRPPFRTVAGGKRRNPGREKIRLFSNRPNRRAKAAAAGQ
jgi:hypothetical protein